MELIGEVFNVGGDEVRKMIKERMARRGMIEDTGAAKKRRPKKRAKKGVGVEKAAEEETPAE
ncbi:MAG: hypothetical protein QUS09_08760 [Methanotrichaceae archaeon]|nr:hypothetical protein [Methanotrichaceae archaeon]